MGQQNSRKVSTSTITEATNENDDNVQQIFVTATPLPAITQRKRRQIQSGSHRRFKKLLKSFLFYTCHCTRSKLRKHVKAKENKAKLLTSFFPTVTTTGSKIISPSAPSDLQLHWLRSSKHSLLSYALSKLAFFSRLSKEKLKEDEKKHGKILKFYRDNNGNVTETLRKISLTELNNNSKMRTKLIHKIFSGHSSVANRGSLRKAVSPEEIYKRNLKKFERLVAITVSSSSSSTSHESISFLNPNKTAVATNINQTEDNNNNNKSTIAEVDENENPVKQAKSSNEACGDNLVINIKSPPRRIITTSKNRVEVDVYFAEWIKKKMGMGEKERSPHSSSPSSPKTKETTAVGKTEVSETSSESSRINKKNNNPSEKRGPFNFFKKGGGKRSSTAGRKKSPGKSARRNTDTSTSTKTTATTATTALTITSNKSSDRRCEKCGPCAGKGSLAGTGAPPAYLDYGEAGAANAAGEAWKGKRKGDPVMDRLKNVDVVEEMTYMVPNPDCCGGGNGDGCAEGDGMEEDDCDFYAVCESCGEMEPVPEELKNELKQKRRKKKGKVETTPVTYSRRQRFNFKNKGDMCDEEDGPPYSYEGLQCPGPGCRCSCCVAGLRRNPDCGCKCCQRMGPARKCNSFYEIPVGKNPQIRRILCPEEECAQRREFCKTLMPDNSGMYKFNLDTQMFERQVPRTPTPIVVEVEAPQPLTKNQLYALGREVQEKNRLGIEVDAYCQRPPQEQNPMYLPPIYGQCNPPQCQPCQPCCVPNYCCGQTLKVIPINTPGPGLNIRTLQALQRPRP